MSKDPIDKLEQFVLYLYDVKDQFKRSVYDRSRAAFEAGDQARDEIRTVEQLKARQAFVREKTIESFGGLPPSDHPLNPRITGIVQCDGYRIEKIVFQPRPSTYVTSNLYIPDGIDEPRGAVLFLCGHVEAAKSGERYQSVCQRIAAEGLVVFAVDPIGQGERLSYYEPESGKPSVRPGVSEHDYAGNQSLPLGDGIARYFVHDAMRAIDYLCTRPEVDPSRIGLTGNSGGGTQSSLLMICDPRIAAAAPGTFIMNRETYLYSGQAQDAEQVWRGLTKFGIDHEDILLAMAPRPVMVLAVTADFFPIEGTRRTVDRTRRFWEMFGIGGMPGLTEDREVHHFTPRLAEAAAAFFAKHLSAGRKPGWPAPRIEPLGASALNCTAGGQVRGDYTDARAVYEENVDRLAEIERARVAVPDGERKEKALSWLRDRVFGGRNIVPLNPRHLKLEPVDGLAVESYVWWSQEGIFNHGFAFRGECAEGAALPVSIGLWERGTKRLRDQFEWIRNVCAQGRIAFVLDVTADGVCTPQPINPRPLHDLYGTIHKLTCDLFWLDDSLAAIRAFDVIRALDMVKELPGASAEHTVVYAPDRYSIFAELAAALDGRISRLEIGERPESVADWVRSRHYDPTDSVCTILPEMLRYFDLPDLRRWRAGAR